MFLKGKIYITDNSWRDMVKNLQIEKRAELYSERIVKWMWRLREEFPGGTAG